MKEINIKNSLKRTIVARKSIDDLVEGQVYELQYVDVRSGRTNLTINGHEYNSVNFVEDENSPLMQAFSRVKEGNDVRVIGRIFDPKEFTLYLGNHSIAEIKKYKLQEMKVFDVITIGRDPKCDINRNMCRGIDLAFPCSVSRINTIIYREADNCWRIIDCSSFGTEIVF